jgi:hypothetical protein
MGVPVHASEASRAWLLRCILLSLNGTQRSLPENQVIRVRLRRSFVGRQSVRRARGPSESRRGACVHETLVCAGGEQDSERAGQAAGL